MDKLKTIFITCFQFPDTCSTSNDTDNTSFYINQQPTREGEFNWDEKVQGFIHGSLFYGYILSQIPGGRLAEIFGGKVVYGFGMFVCSICSLLAPILARWNLTAFIISRVCVGFAEGLLFPAINSMIAWWIPPSERTRFIAIVFTGLNIGTVISMPLSGYFCDMTILGGWPLSFYIFGMIGFIWCIFWLAFVYDTPDSHPNISSDEKYFIEYYNGRKTYGRSNSRTPAKTPWIDFFKSMPLWSLVVVQFCNYWAFYVILICLPTYLNNVLNFHIKSNAVLSATPYLTRSICGILCSFLSDSMLKRKLMSLKASYKFWSFIACFVPSMGLIGITYVNCDIALILLMIAGLGAFNSAQYSGFQSNHIFLTKEYAGTIFGICSMIANMTGFLAPLVTGIIVSGNQTLEQWRIAFCLAAGLNIAGSIFYMFTASVEDQGYGAKNRSDEETTNVNI